MYIRKRRRRWRIPVLLILALVTGLLALSLYTVGTGTGFSAHSPVTGSARAVTANIHSPYAVLLDEGGDILMDKQGDARLYPASLTKIMTATVVLEHMDDLSQPVTLGWEMFDYLYTEGASMAGFQPGETVTAEDLLYGVMLPSAAECSIGLAEHIAGSEAAFVDLMNAKAAELGMTGTHFENATGLHHPDHYSTARDLATLLAYALENETFARMLETPSHSTGWTEYHPEGLTMYSTLFTRLESTELDGGARLLGGKTGYTEAAGLCLASVAEYGGERFILITAGAEGTPEGEALHILDAMAVYGQLQYL